MINGYLILLTGIASLKVEARLLRPSWDTSSEKRDGWIAASTRISEREGVANVQSRRGIWDNTCWLLSASVVLGNLHLGHESHF